MSPLETAAGFVPGLVEVETAVPDVGHPRGELEDALRSNLQRGTCVVSFSGGRDSSVILALAAHLARREGHDLPIAATMTYPGADDPEELRYQDLVLRHLGLEAVRLDGRADKDLLGAAAQSRLRSRGPAWPPFVHDKRQLLDLAQGGTLVTGEGGDEVLGPQRITPVIGTWRRRRRPDAEVLWALRYALLPGFCRQSMLKRRGYGELPWLTPGARTSFAVALRQVEASKPLSWKAGVRRCRASRSAVLGLAELDAFALERGSRFSHPLLSARFVDALAALGGHRGFVNRTEILKLLFSDLLPAEVLSRRTKATFNAAAFGEGARAFVRSWDGGGLPDGLVDADALRTEWQDPAPHAGTFPLMQYVWWATHLS